jgi:hypothetical protein
VLQPREVRRILARLQRRIVGRVPYDVATRTAKIADAINETLPRADALGPGSPGRYVLGACATDYLPTALQAYLDLPRSYADNQVVVDGKTPRALLVEQLDLLITVIGDVVEAVNRADSAKLVVHGRFLATKFGIDAIDARPPSR